MKIVLTNKSDSRELIVDSDSLKLVEANQDGTGGSHIVFASDLGRVVAESPAAIAAVLGVTKVVEVPTGTTVASFAKASKKR